MKKLFIILGIIAIVVVVQVVDRQKKPTSQTTVFPTPATQCFTRSVQATPEAPYSVTEHVELAISNNAVTGTKSGTQSGPDMTNGYEGTLKGAKEGDLFTVVFSYTIEGSAQKEEEWYELSQDSLIKRRYPLVEKQGVLVPDSNKPYIEQVYASTDCTS